MSDVSIPVLSGECPGTVLLGSLDKRCYLFCRQTAERMAIERADARRHGIRDPIDFVFEFDGRRFELGYDDLLRRLLGPVCLQCGGYIKARQGGLCMACVGEGGASENRSAKTLFEAARAFLTYAAAVAELSYREPNGVWNDEVWERSEPEQFALVKDLRAAMGTEAEEKNDYIPTGPHSH
jgi:hypothetical protein